MMVTQTYEGPSEEIAYRASDGVEVWLHWRRAGDRLAVQVSDAKTADLFEQAPKDRGLDVCYHPFACATLQDAA